MTKSAMKSMEFINPLASTEMNKLYDVCARRGVWRERVFKIFYGYLR